MFCAFTGACGKWEWIIPFLCGCSQKHEVLVLQSNGHSIKSHCEIDCMIDILRLITALFDIYCFFPDIPIMLIYVTPNVGLSIKTWWFSATALREIGQPLRTVCFLRFVSSISNAFMLILIFICNFSDAYISDSTTPLTVAVGLIR